MNRYFLAAAALVFLVGLIHSVFGERLIFCRMRKSGVIPTHGGEVLREPHVRILWASWHLGTAMGWGMGALLVWLAQPAMAGQAQVPALLIALALLASSLLVLVGTKGRHPGWIGLLGVALLAVGGVYA